jgi:hypothetical protein
MDIVDARAERERAMSEIALETNDALGGLLDRANEAPRRAAE